MRSVRCTADDFAVSLDRMLAEVADGIDGGLEPVVRDACKTGRDGTRARAPRLTGGYAEGWSYRVDRSRSATSGEVGNRSKPGLAHLLEKGHATIGGGRVEGRPHIAPAAEEAFEVLDGGVSALVDRVLG